MVLWTPIRPSRTNTQKRCSFHHRGLECKSRKSRNTWSNRQIWSWSTEWNRAKANRILPRECIGHSKHPLPTTREDSTHGHHRMVNTEIRLIIFWLYSAKDALWGQQKQDREPTDQDLTAQIMKFLLPNSDLKKVGKTTRPFRYNLNQIPNDYMQGEISITSDMQMTPLLWHKVKRN